MHAWLYGSTATVDKPFGCYAKFILLQREYDDYLRFPIRITIKLHVMKKATNESHSDTHHPNALNAGWIGLKSMFALTNLKKCACSWIRTCICTASITVLLSRLQRSKQPISCDYAEPPIVYLESNLTCMQ